MKMNVERMEIKQAKIMCIVVIVVINAIFFIIAGGNIGSGKTLSEVKGYTKGWEKVDVVIDDVSFEKTGSHTDNGKKIYEYDIKRILKFNYKGIDYEVEDTKTYESKSNDGSVPLKSGYTDEYVYKVNPANPKSVSKSYSIISDSTANIFATIKKIGIIVCIAIPLILDAVVLYKYLTRRKKVFDN